MSGLEKLVSMRGPQLYRSHLGQDMLENIRSSLVSARGIPVSIHPRLSSFGR